MEPPPAVRGALPAAQQPAPQQPALTPVQAARLAAEKRAAAPPPLVHSASSDSHKKDFDPATFDPSAKEKLPFHRLLDSEVRLEASTRRRLNLTRCTTTASPQMLQASSRQDSRDAAAGHWVRHSNGPRSWS